MAEDIKENAMAGGTPARLRGLAANGNSISPTLEEVASAMPVATMEEKGMASAGQGHVHQDLEGAKKCNSQTVQETACIG